MIQIDRITLRDAVFVQEVRRRWTEDGHFNGSVLFQFQDRDGKVIFEIDALDWAPGYPIIHNNIGELVPEGDK